MKNYWLVIAVFTLLTACGSKQNKPQENTVPKVDVRDMKGLKIAYYNSDTLKLNFEYFKREEAIVTKKQEKFQKEVQRRTQEYQNFIVRNNEKLQSGLLSENESMQIQQRAQQMEAELMQYQQNEGARLEKETMGKLETISRKIEAFGKQFSEENGIDILLIHGPGGQINYISSAMDVTKEFTAFLNEHQEEIEKDTKKD
jgi:Skp family chaperone for outer membrane proteins